ncbi:DUF3558 domain-containing protein [Nocardia rhizosphaerae]|uniref:DUF3558 domain-containing protein n=1 Tax=Nocardia rhizosphaerae TaxID=1691571 RepID=A0ABV8L0U4_9NOCA
MVVQSAWKMRVAVGAVAVSAVLAGCDGGGQTAAPQTTVRDLDSIVVFNVCSELSDEVLREVGLDPATKRVVTDPPTGPSTWRVCNWKPLDDRYGSGNRRVGVFSTSHTLAETRAKEGLRNVRSTKVADREGLVFSESSDPDSCYVAFEAEQGMFEVHVGWLSSSGARAGELCDMAARYASELEPHLPE